MSYVIHWFRKDLRLKDNKAFYEACASGHQVLCLYIHDQNDPYSAADAHLVWLHHSLLSLKTSLESKSIRLLIKKGNPKDVFEEIFQTGRPETIYCNERYDNYSRKVDATLKYACEEKRVKLHTHHSNMFSDPNTAVDKNGKYFTEFRDYWAHINKIASPRGLYPVPSKIKAYPYTIHGLEVGDLNLLTSYHVKEAMKNHWKAGEAAAASRLKTFLKSKIQKYSAEKSFPSMECSSKLSPHLNFGEISPFQILEECNALIQKSSVKGIEGNVESFIKDICMGEFCQYSLYHVAEFNHLLNNEIRDNFPWVENQMFLTAWKEGKTGYPIIDAAMRQLQAMGFMHSVVESAAAVFLTQDLRIHAEEGIKWYYKNLFGLDIAINTYNWYNAAGLMQKSSSPFKSFNPTILSSKIDKEGKYIKTWLPELKKLPTKYIHAPSKAPAAILKKAGIALGTNYPMPVVDHTKAAKETLSMLKARAKSPAKAPIVI